MSEFIAHHVDRGLARLLSLPRDLDESWPRPQSPITLPAASAAHRVLFQKYEKELADDVKTAMDWWKRRLNVKLEREKLDRNAAMRSMYQDTIAGPAAAPEIVYVVRKYWIECEKLNVSPLPHTQWVPPEVFLMGWLMDGAHESALEVLSGMIYWPIGLDKNGAWS